MSEGDPEATSSEATPSEATSSEATPSDATSSDATPSEATPSEATPSEATPSGSLGRLLAKATSGVFVVRVAGQAMMLGVMVLLARIAGPAEFSRYVYVLAWANVAVLVTKVGLDTSVLRFVASYAAEQQWGKLRGLWRWANRTVLVVSATVATLAAATVVLLVDDRPTVSTALWAAPVVPFLGLAALRSAALQGLRHHVRALLPQMVLRPVLHGVLVVAVAFGLSSSVDAPRAMQLYLVAVAIAFGVGAWWWTRARPEAVQATPAAYETSTWLTTGVSLLLVSGSYYVTTQTDIIMVGALLGEPDAGYYYAASRLAQFVVFGMVVVQAVAAPMISGLYSRGQMDRLQRVLRLSALGSTGFALLVGASLAFAAEPVLELFGASFSAGASTLRILCGGHFVSAATGLTGVAMSMTGRHRAAAVIVGTFAVVNIGLNAALIPVMGRDGAAVATAISNVAWNAVAVVYIFRSTRLLTVAVPWATRPIAEAA